MRLATVLPVLALALPLALTPSSGAGQGGAPAPVAATAPAPASAVDGERLRAAEALLGLMPFEATMQASVQALLRLQVEQTPELAPFEDVMREWARRTLTWETVGPRMAALWARHFTTEELRAIAAFFGTPAGQRLAQVQPTLSEQEAAIGAAVAQEHAGELETMLAARAKELGLTLPGAPEPPEPPASR